MVWFLELVLELELDCFFKTWLQNGVPSSIFVWNPNLDFWKEKILKY